MWKLHLQVGQMAPPRTSRSAGSSAGTSASSTRPGTTAGCSATATAAPTCSSSPGRPSSGTCRSRARHPPMTRPWPDTGHQAAREDQAPAGHAQPAACSPAATGAARSAGTCCSTPTRATSTQTSGNSGIKVTRKAIRHQAIALDTRPGTPRRTRRVQPHPHPLPAPPPRRHRWWTSTSALTFTPSGLARAGCPESGHGRFQGGGGAAMRRRYPTGRGRSAGWRPRGSSASWPTPSRSRTCPAGRSGTRRTPAGWLSALSAARSGPASCRTRSSASSGCIPATGGT